MGDVVVSLNNESVRTNTDFMVALAERQPGDEVNLGIIRYGKRVDAKVQLGQFETARERPQTVASRPTSQDLLGFTPSTVNSQNARALRVDPRDARGQVIITEVDPMGPAARVVSPGSEIVSINGQQIDSVQDVERVASKLKPGDTVSIVTKGPLGNQISNYRTRS
jgi:S1-C subfamily serine protease